MRDDSEVLRVILVGTDLITLASLRDTVRSQPDLEIAAEAWSLDRAADVISQLSPDVAVVDVSNLGDEGIREIQHLRTDFPDVHIVAVSSFVDALYAERVVRAGALGYVVTTSGLSSLPEAIRSVVGENAYVSRRVARSILTRMMQPPSEDPYFKLTHREREIFDLLVSLDASEIAQRLGLTRRTVTGYCRRIRSKLDIDSASELVAYARRWHSEHA